MTKTFTLKGLNCPNCAAKIERSVRAIEGVQGVTVNPVTAILNVEFGEHLTGQIAALIERAVHKYEPEVSVIDQAIKKDERHEEGRRKLEIMKLVMGAAVFAASMLVENVFALELPPYTPLAVFIIAYILLGGNVVLRALKNLIRGQIFDENF
jgi:Cd2+/Zn2+-exporting ATPase